MNNRIIKFSAVLVMLIMVCCLVLVGCNGENSSTKETDEEEMTTLPYHLYNKSAKCIAYTKDKYLYSYSTRKGIGFYDSERQFFVTENGEYLGEIVCDNVLINNTRSPYKNIKLNRQISFPIAPIPRIPPIRATVPILPSSYKDVVVSSVQERKEEVVQQKYQILLSKTNGGWVNGSMVLSTGGSTNKSFYENDLITLYANTSPGYTFMGWYSNGKFVSSNAAYTFTMQNCNMHIEAIFFQRTYSFQVLPQGRGSVSYSISRAAAGTRITISVNSYPVSNFVGWYYNGRLLSKSKVYIFTMPANDVTIYARFS
ncbi:MAG: InlB B-repeat-containing protein [Eubacteriales bacterium]|nr:InlB B-repeat-containing protein [Eubacteriales bacterium]